MADKLHILVIHPRFCIRASKQIEALLSTGLVKVSLVIEMKYYESRVSDLIKSNVKIHNMKFRDNALRSYQLQRLIKRLTPSIDIIHFHNEPNFPLRVILSKFKNVKPIVYDIHDMTSMRTNRPEPDEEYAYKNADAIIHVSDKFITYGDEKYGSQNSHSLLSLPSRTNILKRSKVLRSKSPYKFVYQGGVIDSEFEKRTHTYYRDYFKIFKSILDEGHSIDVFSASDTHRLPTLARLAEENANFRLNKPLPYKELLPKMHEFDYGIVGFNFDYDVSDLTRDYLNAAMGNKLFDYIFAGIPVVAINADAMSEFIQNHACGFVKTQDTRWSDVIDPTKIRPDLHTLAEEYSMENQISKLIDIYNNLLVRTP